MDDLITLYLDRRGPIRDFAPAKTAIVRALDLVTVVEHYADDAVDDTNRGYAIACFLPSKESEGLTCAEHDRNHNGGLPAVHLHVTQSEDGTHYRWRCFSCGRPGQTTTGDVIDLIQAAEGFDANDGRTVSLRAVRQAAKWAGLEWMMDGCKPRPGRDVPDERFIVGAEAAERIALRAPAESDVGFTETTAGRFYSGAVAHWHKVLRDAEDPTSHKARVYLASRGVTDAQIRRYALGYARDKWTDLSDRESKTFWPWLFALGVLKQTRDARVIDAYRDRLITPLCFPHSLNVEAAAGFSDRTILGLSARSLAHLHPDGSELTAEQFAALGRIPERYKNGPRVDGIFDRRNALYGVWQAQARANESRRLVLVEGQFDVWAFDRLNAAAICPLGSAFGHGHAEALVRYFPKVEHVTIAIDGDAAGRESLPKTVAALMAVGFDISQIDVIASDDGSDPAETPADVLAVRLASPLEPLAFIASLALEPSKLRPLAAVDPDIGARFGVSTRTSKLTPAGALARVLRSSPDDVRCIGRDDASELFAGSPAWATLRGLDFGDTTHESSMSPELLRTWLHAAHDATVAAFDALGSAQTRGGDELRAWMQRRAKLNNRMHDLAARLRELPT